MPSRIGDEYREYAWANENPSVLRGWRVFLRKRTAEVLLFGRVIASAGNGRRQRETVQERRRQERIETNEAAYIFGDGSSTRCRVVDITDHGASIELPASAGHNMRDRFKLMIAKDSVERNCRLIWRSRTRIGVEFTE